MRRRQDVAALLEERWSGHRHAVQPFSIPIATTALASAALATALAASTVASALATARAERAAALAIGSVRRQYGVR